MTSASPTLSFIILAWNSQQFLAHCFDSILGRCACEGIPFEIVVIDNGSSDGSRQILEEYQGRFPDSVRPVLLDRNLGTTASRNIGLGRARGEYICILDSDTELGDASLGRLLARLGSDETIGIIAPRLLLPDGTVQNSVKRFPTFVQKLLKLPRICLGIKTPDRDFYPDFPFAAERPADTAISACWFLRKSTLQQVGGLDEKIFYSPEDLDYSLRVWQAGYSILYYPDFTVLHHTQQISHRKPLSKTSVSHFLGLLYYYRKHGGWLFRKRLGQS